MADTRLSDLIEPAVFEGYLSVKTTELSELWQSGLIATSEEMRALANAKGKVFDLPFFNDLPQTESEIGSDDPAVDITPEKIDAGEQLAIKHYRNKSWSSMDILKGIVGEDPMMEIAAKVGGYWTRDYQATSIASLIGIEADNVANDAGDMVIDVATDDVLPILAAEKISGPTVLDALQTSGDHQTVYTTILMHSVVYTELRKQSLIEFVRDADNNTQFAVYGDLRVIVDDGVPVVAGSNRSTYTSYLFGPSQLLWGEGDVDDAVEVDRNPEKGNGSGNEVLYNRKQFILHPGGFAFLNSSVASTSPTNAELNLAANWNRVLDRKLINLAIVKTNG